MDAIANWLTDHNTYKWLEIEQADMEMIRYHCVISDLTPIQISWLPWAFTATVTCDSPYAYMFPRTFTFDCSAATAANPVTIQVYNASTLSRPYYPDLQISKASGVTSLSIVNTTMDNETFSLGVSPAEAMPSSEIEFNVDQDAGIIASQSFTEDD